MNYRYVAALLALVTVFAGVPAPVAATDQTAQCTFPMTVTDATGTEVNITENPERVVTTNPSAAQTMWEIGAKDEVVGVSQYATYLDGASEKTNVSASSGLNVEVVIDLDPDLVLVPNSSYNAEPDRIEQLRSANLTVVVFESGKSLDGVANKTERIGRMTGNCDSGLERAEEMRTSIQHMEQALDGVERPVGLNAFFGYTSGKNTFISEIMTTAGLRNGAAEANITGFGQINEETVVDMNPEYIVVPSHAPVPSSPAYNSTTAIQEGNVIVVDANKLQQPAPRAVEASEEIMKAVHPDAYEQYQELQNESVTESTDSATETTTQENATENTTEEEPETTATPEQTTESDAPGFGSVVSVIALAAVALLARYR
ncbi:PGF-CTERM sorting domain-containing protein [Haloferax mediterranei ATCC 33500]|uniref:ABC-type cobalamin/Iron(III)-siderophore transport system, substrate-binding protein n=1 Tax=Haloferax mediterranei (strain ATCC 33500 / DSM 1411 / JCM 8866 / NBRC 14739 / NCIMB 2177 / R-4) TaxID=523841 RepID=I3R3M4_HALMT|nr:PGF-CTERM-anchored ABC transporter substrate-binding protein [Haloferax mediterranei]AFK18834.1 ABC-type cobalamin/Iron(III)-siderophore transport systems, substrate-binding protein [Haloferax mediterranei ATCC 33500]AHZ21800.1 cobalamin ABC transporter substrate-binding protein [Haloferax mediterranei ATCC 33500]EMA03307.1 ABC-type cobalamin/Iron(III)-siderophore transport system, substrate-binding protein [Haloferax mediterranei ATCC 33500]MDX5988928.1 PGF-CTERM-anchored ABC transporter su